MSSYLLNNIKINLDDAITSEKNIVKIFSELDNYYNGLLNEKAKDVAGLHRPNFFTVILEINAQIAELENERFRIVTKLHENAIDNWNECIAKIPKKNDFELEGINTWCISLNYEMVPNNEDVGTELFKKEAAILFRTGFDIGINTDKGTGTIFVVDDGYIIRLWQNLKKTDIKKLTLGGVLDWIECFYDTESLQ